MPAYPYIPSRQHVHVWIQWLANLLNLIASYVMVCVVGVRVDGCGASM